MTINDKLAAFVDKWQFTDANPELALEYLPLAGELLYASEDLVRYVTDLLTRNISSWAVERCPMYARLGVERVWAKPDLLDKRAWFLPGFETADMATSGTTTGYQFEYRRWDVVLPWVEVENHYKMILREFGHGEGVKVLFLLLNYGRYPNEFVRVGRSDNFMERHGADDAEVHFVEGKELYRKSPDAFFEKVIDYLIGVGGVDVILTSGPHINTLARCCRRLGIKERLCGLLSNTYNPLAFEDADYLVERGIVGAVCNHMRCWDGGASFFTCRFGTYHLLDNLSWCREDNGRLISTDYFSFPNPFVNYWNGDYARIGTEYKRCECGRLYRPFVMERSRPFSVKGRCVEEWREGLREIGVQGIKRINCLGDYIEVFSEQDLSESDQRVVRDIIRDKVLFRVMK